MCLHFHLCLVCLALFSFRGMEFGSEDYFIAQYVSIFLTFSNLFTITSGEEIGSEMTLRTFEHLLHYGELPVRRAVPLALALLYLSHPDYSVVDQLSRLSHDADADIAQCAILGLGLVAGGECLF